jgi:hypothetical protein
MHFFRTDPGIEGETDGFDLIESVDAVPLGDLLTGVAIGDAAMRRTTRTGRPDKAKQHEQAKAQLYHDQFPPDDSGGRNLAAILDWQHVVLVRRFSRESIGWSIIRSARSNAIKKIPLKSQFRLGTGLILLVVCIGTSMVV